MKRLLFILLCLPLFAAAQNTVPGGGPWQHVNYQGLVSVDKTLILPIKDTGQVNPLFLAPLWTGVRKEGALGWSGFNLFVWRGGRWRCLNCGGSGSPGGPTDTAGFGIATEAWVRANYVNTARFLDSVAKLRQAIGTGTGGSGTADSGKFLTRYRADSLFRRQPVVFSVLDYGAIPNGPNNTQTRAANSTAIVAAYSAAFTRGCGRVYVPAGKYYVNPMDLPAASNTTGDDTTGWRSVTIEGEALPPYPFGTVGTVQVSKGGSIIECPNQTAGESIFYQTPKNGYFSGNIIKFANLELRTYNQPQIAAIHAGWAGQLIVENCQITTGVYSVQASVPNMNVAIGIVTPYINNNALTILDNVQISGYYVGVQVNEHTRGDYLNLTCNLIGLEFAQANHLSYFGRVTMQRNQIGMRFTGTHYVDVAQFNIEHPAPTQTDANNAWQLALYDFDDPSNYAIGSLTWGTTVGNVGPAGEFFKRGGANYCTHRIGTPPCVDTTSVTGLNGSLAALRAAVNGKLAGNATITINGSTQSLSSNPSFSIATGSGAPDSSIYVTVSRLRDSMTVARAQDALRVKYTDTAAMLSPYARSADVYTVSQANTAISSASTNDRARANHTGTQDTSTIANLTGGLNVLRAALDLRLKYTDTAGMLSNIYGLLNSRVRYADTAGMLANLYTLSNARVRYADTSAMLANLYTLINGKANTSHTQDTSTITNLTAGLNVIRANVNGKANTVHTHDTTDINNLTSGLNVIRANVNGKQATLVSGTNIKTINGNSLLGSGDLTISGGGGGGTIDSATLYRYRTVKWGEIMSPNTTTATLQNSGGWIGSASVSGTSSPISQYSQSNASLIRSTVNTTYACSTAANSFAGVYVARTQMYRSNNSVGGGYYFYYEFADSAFNSDSRLFVGTTAALAGTPVTSNPSALVNSIGFGKDAGDTYPSIFSNDGTGTATKTPLPVPTAINTSAIYKVEITCPRNVSYCRVKVVENTWANGAVTLFDDNITSDLPTPGVFVGPYGAIGNGSNTTSQIVFNFIKMRGETE